MAIIRGEYWIINGQATFADGNVGDYSHESIAMQHVVQEFTEPMIKYAGELGIESKIKINDEIDVQQIFKLFDEIYNFLYNSGFNEKKIVEAITKNTGMNADAYKVIFIKTNAVEYVINYENWIAVRGMNIELYGFDENKRKSLLNGLNDILDNEDIQDEEQLEFSLYDNKTGKSVSLSLADLENQSARINSPIVANNSDVRFIKPSDDIKPKIPFKLDSFKNKLQQISPGNDIWRGTSESFKEWLLKRN